MELKHTFTVPASVEDTWEAFTDLEMVAGCFPGATLSSVEGDEFTGSCKVKLGPIALVYTGSGRFVERDQAANRFVIEAKGKEKRGNGTAGATVTAELKSATLGSTNVEVVTDLSITGKPAQFGRGVIQDVSDKLLQQFVTCLQSKVSAEEVAAAETVTSAVQGETPSPHEGIHPGARKAPASTYSGVSAGEDLGEVREGGGRREPDALDLGAAVVPVLLRSYWKPVVAALAGLWLLRRLLRRR